MSELAKATLTELNASNTTVGQPVAVQFNPASLRLLMSNRSSGGAQAGAPARQQAGESAMSLSFDLQFDSADEGTADAPVSVLRKTAEVERFVRPRGNQPGEEAPPRVQFEWGAVKLQGVMESLSLDLDLFAFDGTPLRARCAVQIKGQDPAYRYAPSGAGAGTGAGATAAARAGSPLDGLVDSTRGMAAMALGAVTRALGGESLPQLASRMGLDPRDWRLLGSGAADPQRLPAGQEVGVPSRGAGSGLPSMVESGALGPALKDAFSRPGGGTASQRKPVAQAVTRAGGLGAVSGEQSDADHRESAERRRSGFGMTPAAPGAAAPALAAAVGAGRSGASSGVTRNGPALAPSGLPDDRPYGFGLPLKPRRAIAAGATPPAPTLRRRCPCSGPCGCSH